MIIFDGLLPKQRELINGILNSKAKYHILNASRQSSKTFTLSKLAIIYSLIDNDDILVVSPSYSQAEIIFNNIINTEGVHNLITRYKSSKPQEIHWKTGASIRFRSADIPKFIRGGSYKYVFCDEFAFFKPGVFNNPIRQTANAKQNSRIIIASTPKGIFNEFYEYAKLGKSDNKNYQYYTMHYTDNIYYDLNEVEDAKLRLPPNVFNQEYEAQFVDDGGDVFEEINKVTILDAYQPFDQKERYFAGIDWGRVNDKTVLTVLNKNKEVVFCKSYKGNWNKQVNDMGLILKQFKPIAYAESNGIGDPLITQLKKEYVNVRPFITSNSIKKEIIENLKMDIITETILLPTNKLCKALSEELSNYTYSISKIGNIQYHHRPGEHDDFVDSLAISNYCYDKHNIQFKSVIQAKRSNFYN